MLKDLWCIICVSTASKDLNINVARPILTDMRELRKKHHLTGLSVYGHKNVLTLIEGAKEQVVLEYRSILKHPGHHTIIKLLDAPILYACFQDYPLALRAISADLKPLDDFQDPDMEEYLEEFVNFNQPASRLVKDFIKNNS